MLLIDLKNNYFLVKYMKKCSMCDKDEETIPQRLSDKIYNLTSELEIVLKEEGHNCLKGIAIYRWGYERGLKEKDK